MLTVKWLKQLLKKFIEGKSSLQLNGKLRWISGRFHTLIWRLGVTAQNLESPELSGRVGESWQHCHSVLHSLIHCVFFCGSKVDLVIQEDCYPFCSVCQRRKSRELSGRLNHSPIGVFNEITKKKRSPALFFIEIRTRNICFFFLT